MKRSRYSDEQISYALRQAETGTTVTDLCRQLGVSDASLYLRKKKYANLEETELRELVHARPRYGYRRVHVLLRRDGWPVNLKRVRRLYRLDGLQLRHRVRRRKHASLHRGIPPAASRAHERWGVDFLHDALFDGRTFRILTVVDQWTRWSPILEAAQGMSGRTVAAALDRAIASHGVPRTITAPSSLRERWMDGLIAVASHSTFDQARLRKFDRQGSECGSHRGVAGRFQLASPPQLSGSTDAQGVLETVRNRRERSHDFLGANGPETRPRTMNAGVPVSGGPNLGKRSDPASSNLKQVRDRDQVDPTLVVDDWRGCDLLVERELHANATFAVQVVEGLLGRNQK